MTDVLTHDHAEIDGLLRDLMSASGGGAREVFAKLDYLWARLAVHVRAEHLHLFPALLASVGAARDEGRPGAPSTEEVNATVARLREDHDFLMRELAAAVGDARAVAAPGADETRERLLQIEGRVLAVAGRLAAHNRVEEDAVYRWPAALLGKAERDTLCDELRREIENLPPRFSGGRGR